MRKPLFENRLFRFLGFYLALFGSSGRLRGRSWRQNASQNGPKSDPKSGPKSCPKLDLILSSSWTHFGTNFGVQNGGVPGTRFLRFSGAPIWLHFGAILAPSWLHFGSILAPLGPSWRPLGPILAPSWPILGSLGALLALSWPHLGIVLRHLAFTLALFRLSLAMNICGFVSENAALTSEEYSPQLLHKASRVHGHFGFQQSIELWTCITSQTKHLTLTWRPLGTMLVASCCSIWATS